MLLALTYFSFLTVRDQPLGDYIEGEHYQLAEAPTRVSGEAVEVMEFFSYGCVHCYNFDPDLEDWVQDQGGKINFLRLPLIGSDYWRMLGRAFYTMQALDMDSRHHHNLFRQIHGKGVAFNSPDKLQAFFEDAGVSPEDFERTFNSAEVARQVSRAGRLARRLQVSSVPTIVVQGKYVVKTTRSMGPKRMLEVMTHLLGKVQAEKSGAAQVEGQTPS